MITAALAACFFAAFTVGAVAYGKNWPTAAIAYFVAGAMIALTVCVRHMIEANKQLNAAKRCLYISELQLRRCKAALHDAQRSASTEQRAQAARTPGWWSTSYDHSAPGGKDA